MKKEIALVYMAAGLSSRFGGKIKQFVEVNKEGESLIEYSLRQALRAGFSRIVFVVGEKTEKPFKEKFGDSFEGVPVSYAFQSYNSSERDRPWGTTDALCAAADVVDTPFVVCNGDDIYGAGTFKALFEHLQDSEDAASVAYKLGEVIPQEGSTSRGIFEVDEEGYVKRITENKVTKSSLESEGFRADDLCSMNIFAFHPRVFPLLKSRLDSVKKENKGDRKAECMLPVEISVLVGSGEIKMRLHLSSEKWIGVTNPGDEKAVREFIEGR